MLSRQLLCRQCGVPLLRTLRPAVNTTTTRFYATAPNKLPRDRLIKASKIQLIDESGSFRGDQNLRDVLRSYDPSAFTLVNLTPHREVPTCRLYTHAAVQEMDTKAYAKKREKKGSGGSGDASKVVKECILNWNCTEHDLSHKLESARNALKRGNKVDIGIGTKRKRGAKIPADIKKHALLQRVKELCDPLGKQWKPSQGSIQTGIVLYYLGTPAPPAAAGAKSSDIEDSDNQAESKPAQVQP